MDTQHHDKVFFATFAIVLGFLGAFTLSIMFVANLLDEPAADPAELVKIEERIRPAGVVITDAAALMKVSAPVARAPMTGPEIVAKVCGACHNSGVLNAPKTGVAADWAPRGGLAALVASASKGKGSMPARGGDPSLSDAELKAAIQVLLKGS